MWFWTVPKLYASIWDSLLFAGNTFFNFWFGISFFNALDSYVRFFELLCYFFYVFFFFLSCFGFLLRVIAWWVGMRLRHLNFFLNKKFNFVIFLKKLLPSKILYIFIKSNMLEIYLKKFDLIFIVNFLQKNFISRFDTLLDIQVVDNPQQHCRFKLVYQLLSYIYNFRITLNIFTEENSPASSLLNVFSSSVWLEREAWDMFGIIFFNNNDLRRILTDYGFRGFPFRKDFPLTGYIELRHDDSRADIVYEPLELTQELRFFNFSTGWEKDL